jgi:putative endonuclease
MNYFYLIKSISKNWIYSGSTKNLKLRFSEHAKGKVRSTKAYRPFELIYYEAYNSSKLARKRELEIKNNGQQKEILFKRLGINGEVA